MDMTSLRHKLSLLLILPCVFLETSWALSDSQRERILTIQYLNQRSEFIKQQRWDEALRVTRQLAALALDQETWVNVRAMAIDSVTDHVGFAGHTVETDQEALGYYREATVVANALQKSQLDHMMAKYYGGTGRLGLAIPHVKRELAYWQDTGNTFQTLVAFDALASTYGGRGELALRDLYREKALTMADRYFEVGVRPERGQEWVTYSAILQRRMDDIVGPGKAEQIKGLWRVLEPLQQYTTNDYLDLIHMAQYLAIAGEEKEATAFLAAARREARRDIAVDPEMEEKIELDLQCAKAVIMRHAGDWPGAALEFDECFDARREIDMGSNLSLLTDAALAKEMTGELDAAIHLYKRAIATIESARTSFDVAQRTFFFRTSARQAYWGIVRTLAKQAQSEDAGSFDQALWYTEQIRGRQLGELLDDKRQSSMDVSDMRRLRESIASDTAVIGYLLTDQSIVLQAFDQDASLLRPIEYEPDRFEAQLKELARRLADPASREGRIEGELSQLSETLLGPAEDLLQGKQRIIVLLDGVLNMIPFDLLYEPSSSQMLIDRYSVQLLPALGMLKGNEGRNRRSKRLFAVADPAYAGAYQLDGIEESEMRQLTRGSELLGYFQRLPETRTEVLAISKYFDEGAVSIHLAEAATESLVKQADLDTFDYLHFATHGILGGEVPGIAEPALVLANESGEDGLLTASEVEALSLDADLAVLSACKTGSGEYVTGEGVMGMSRAFLVGGSRSVLVSLWSVDSKGQRKYNSSILIVILSIAAHTSLASDKVSRLN